MKLPRAESLILLVFLGCVAVWAVSKCSSRRSDLVRRVREISDTDTEDRPVRRDTVVLTQPVAAAPAPAPVNTQRPTVQPLSSTPVTPVQQSVTTTPQPTLRAPVPTTAKPSATPTPAKPSATPSTPSTSAATSKYSTLFVTIDGLKMRKQPGLKGELVAQLDLYEQVYFLNQKSEKTEEISLGYEKVTDHWVKVRTKSGKEGWVFGAGVHYYKMKRKGVME